MSRRLLPIAVFGALALAGCGDDSSGADPQPLPPAPEPDALGFAVPDPEPALPAGVDPYRPPAPDDPSLRDTAIAAGLRMGVPEDTLVVTGDGFVPGTTRFDVFGQSAGQEAGTLVETEPPQMEELIASVLLPDSLPAPSMYLVYPRTGARGLPWAVNRAAARWVGPDQASPGHGCALYGTSLSYGHGTETAYVYLKPEGSSEGQWITPTEVNPYRVAFDVPAELTPGTYEVWAHNGHGGRYGFSGPVELEVVAPPDWSGYDAQIFDVTDYGAVGDGQTDDFDALRAALDAATEAGPATVHVPAGTYAISTTLRIPRYVRVQGDGVGQTIIESTPGFQASNDWLVWNGPCHEGLLGSELVDMTLDSTPGDNSEVLRWRQCTDGRLANVHLIGDVDLHEMHRLSVTDVVIDGHIFFGAATQTFVDRCTSNVGEHRDVLTIWGGEQIAFQNHVAQDLAPGQTGGVSSGRLLVIQGHWGSSRDIYIGDSQTIDLSPALDKPDQNSGEQILFEMVNSAYQGTATPATETTATLPGMDAEEISVDESELVVVQGKGLGQRATIVAIDEGAGTVTLSQPFRVIPDETSVVTVSRVVTDFVVYRTSLQGKADFAERETASSGVQPWGNSFDIVVDQSTFDQLGEPWTIWGIKTDHADRPLAPCYFNSFVNNQSTDVEVGALQYAGFHAEGVDEPIGLLGNCVRNNDFSNVTEAGITLAGDGSMAFNVWDANRFYDAFRGVRARRSDDAPVGGFEQNLLLRSTFERGAAPLSGSVGFDSDPEITWVLTDTTFEGYESGEP
ncbi:MAG: hypothetical protein JRI23_03875 [Deltaproteobacteria bacterium]|jgi:hypothetical protein|nr:hypothetical protein [Deltaproteobacteria bacterium]MBW2530667.1 hypothetical protein [Deltaproteobacteria bacterium]